MSFKKYMGIFHNKLNVVTATDRLTSRDIANFKSARKKSSKNLSYVGTSGFVWHRH